MTFNDERLAMLALPPGQTKERDLSWLDYSQISDLSNDGKVLLFSERGDGAEAHGTAFYRKTDGSPAVRLGEGVAVALSPDGGSVVGVNGPGDREVIFPTGAGEKKSLSLGFVNIGWQKWMPDGTRFILYAREKGHDWRLYIVDPNGTKKVAITPEGVVPLYSWTVTISPDGKFVIAVGKDQKVYRYPIDGGQPILIPGLSTEEEPFQWSADGKSIYIYKHGELPARVFEVDIATGERKLFKELMPSDPSGVTGIENLRFTPDAKSYAYSYERVLSTLYIVSGF
jgi:Tol biopolymer transport system component